VQDGGREWTAIDITTAGIHQAHDDNLVIEYFVESDRRAIARHNSAIGRITQRREPIGARLGRFEPEWSITWSERNLVDRLARVVCALAVARNHDKTQTE
jgi:hypothetical protein